MKGTTTSGDQVLLTKNEVKLAQDPEAKTVLFIQHHVQLEKDGSKPKASGGHSRIIEPWQPEDGQLTPITYRCQV